MKISLAQQIEAVEEAAVRQTRIARGSTIRKTRTESVEIFDAERLHEARRTLVRLRDALPEIQAFVDLPPDRQRAALEAAGVKL